MPIHLRDELTFNVIVMNWSKSFLLPLRNHTNTQIHIRNVEFDMVNIASFIIFGLNAKCQINMCVRFTVSSSPINATKDGMKLQPFVFMANACMFACIWCSGHAMPMGKWFVHNAYIGQTSLWPYVHCACVSSKKSNPTT